MSKIDILVLSASAAAFMMVACGDDVTEINNNSAIAVLKPGEKLSKQFCDSTNAGELLFVTDSSETFFCNGDGWTPLKGVDGKDGAKGDKGDQGKTGKDGETTSKVDTVVVRDTVYLEKGEKGLDGKSCSAKTVKKKDLSGVEISCGDDVVDTLWNGTDGVNGEPGKKGEPGDAGTSCTAAKVEKDGRDGVELSCDGEVIDTVWNGTDGKNGKSAYEIAKENGFDGSEEEWLESLKADAIYGQFVDERDGQLYRTVRIGEQVWMAQNLNYGDSSKTPNLKGATWCGGGEDGTVNEGDCSIYGRLYTWAAAVNEPEDKCGYGHECNLSGPVQGICPDGWHLPDTSEFRTLWNAVGGQDVAGTMLKSTNGWVYDGNGLDTNGFSAFPAGYRSSGGYFSLVGNGAHFWSSTENNSYNSYNVYLYCTIASADKYDYSKDYGFSIRCLKNSN